MQLRRRMIMVSVAVAMCIGLYTKGHGTLSSKDPVAFLHYSAASVAVRLVSGGVHGPDNRISLFSDGTSVVDVIKMTERHHQVTAEPAGVAGIRLHDGDVLQWKVENQKVTEISVNRMNVQERILLGIPLRVDELDLADWECLPGIGPALSKRIVAYRQKNGDFGAIANLTRVEGVGEEKLKRVSRYFYPAGKSGGL